MAAQTKKKGARKYFKSVKSELKKVSWPNRKELQSYTMVVLVTCGLAALGIWLTDSIFGQVIKLLIK
ncbi:preprotein translocase subunit SecE [Paramaledivibacter caminithermalis]|jgi:preprotein translocase subunit SecE|uniref:Protein translocase subunit SecE n=1 Tax=Paramaledivibacter caminithermalis (strain DSM 15212 / CIP 107654 / DViRD3) TaxID=1121301 RepID=A0A1M6SK95_PARC5|nr:preprotein translocase subunit SecE [Paramaledivibacter caminithermalis]SHK45152.1 preprotein translocase subunit SecE [Paramaledivibacter caminithermalis DSM 15212]